ncbi:MAG: fumarate hydratase [Thermoplasmatales archaeon]|nr:fumarate hydratase [Thermoplasmatales archaeon]
MLELPLSEADARSLRVGETVYLSGEIITARDRAHARILERVALGERLPDHFYGAAVFHCGPIVAGSDGNWLVMAAGPTTSSRMDAVQAPVIEALGLRAVIGKGGMSADVGKTMESVGCVYLAATGGAAVTLAESVNHVIGVDWADLGMAEAVWRFRVSRFGPLIVAMDAHGNSLYADVERGLK